jgi:hypothetical protein
MLQLVSNHSPTNNDNRPSNPTLWTESYILKLMKLGELTLHRDTHDGFIYMMDSYDDILPINQALAKSVIKNPAVYQERWREGWVETRDVGKVRWRAD